MSNYAGLSIPTLPEISARIEADILASTNENASLRFSILNTIAKTLTGAIYEMYGYVDWVADQTNILSCESVQLDTYGKIWGIERVPASKAIGIITLTGVVGSVIPKGTLLRSIMFGMQYQITEDTTLTTSPLNVVAEAIDYGSQSNLFGFELLEFTNPIPGVDVICQIVSMDGGLSSESDEQYRLRILNRIKQPPHGGNAADYLTWCYENSEVTRAWVNPLKYGEGTVRLLLMMDGKYEDGIPLPVDISSVTNYINERRPICAHVYVEAPVPEIVNIDIVNIETSVTNHTILQDAIISELKDMFRTKVTPGRPLHLAWIYEAVSLATGEHSHQILTPASTVYPSADNVVFILGTVSFMYTSE
jgi:uncharacterized phage protein gp47/JayE